MPVLHRKIAPSAAHPGHHFIGNEKHTPLAANRRHFLEVSRRRSHCPQRGSTDWFKDEGSRLAVGLIHCPLELGGVLLAAVVATVRAVELAAITVGNADVRELLHHRQVNLAPLLVAGNRERPQRRAVIALLPADDLIPRGLSDLHLVLPRQLERSLNRLRPAAGKVNASPAKCFPRELEQLLRIFFRDRSGELAAVNELQLRGLRSHYRRNLRHAMPDEIHRRRAREIEIAFPLAIPHVHTLSPDGRGKRLSKRTPQNR